MLIVEGTLTVDPSTVETAIPLVTAVVQATRAEPGCVDYVFSEEIGSPGTIRVFERWTDRDALERHFTTEHFKAWRKAADELDIIRRSLVVYDDVNQPIDL